MDQAADAVSAYTQVKMEDANKLLKIPKSECPDIWIRLPRHKWPKSWSSMEDPVVPLERNLYGHPLAGLLWERQFEKILLKHGWEKIPNWECLFVHREKGLFLSVYVDDIKLAGKKHNIDPMWKVLNKEVGLGEPTSFLDHVYLGCTQRKCEISKDIVDNYRTMFESRISAGGLEKLPFPQNIRISSWSYDMAVKTTLTKPLEQKLTSTVATGGFTQTWQTSIRCQQGINLISRRRCRQCTASSKRRTRSNMQNGHKVPPLLLGNGKQTGGSPIMSTHHKDGMTTD